ncbi:SigE family RNA polymerase sigma factor [Krasilnikovia sp. MM14-A1004]|uniref:SigE family RNA polymerase sigma factor n=1 Tax=Krasilnikovia sp. MM14-A1004 TaxID=3373541 RepID=UPI00399CE09F
MRLLRRSGRTDVDEAFAAYYAARGNHLRNTAYLLCGDWHLAEDLTQTAFTKLYRAWHRIEQRDSLDGYARRVLVRAFLDERRRPWRREHATVPESPALDGAEPGGMEPGDRMLVRAALATLAPRYRAVLVLRFWADLPVEQVADILGCATGTVKSQTSRGLAALRDALTAADPELAHTIAGGRL